MRKKKEEGRRRKKKKEFVSALIQLRLVRDAFHALGDDMKADAEAEPCVTLFNALRYDLELN